MYGELKVNRKLTVIRFGGDFRPSEESHGHLKRLVEECEDLYPGIDVWFKRRVIPGLKDKARIALLVYHDGRPTAASVLKKGDETKLCSLRVLPDEQGKRIGSLLMALIGLEIRHSAEGLHFTIPEQLWSEKGEFFQDYGFVNRGPAHAQYRLFDQELACRADFHNFWDAVLLRLPSVADHFTMGGNSLNCDLVLSILPTHAQKIISGKKKIEIRRKFSKKWKGANVLLYASSPQREFLGEAIIGDIITATPETIWSNWENDIGCTFEEFTTYSRGAAELSALMLIDVKPFKHPIFITQMQHLIKQDLVPPQSHCEVKNNTVWPLALSLSSLLLSNR